MSDKVIIFHYISADYPDSDRLLKFTGELRMDSCSAVQRIVAILVIVAGACGDVYAGPVYTYHGSFNLPIPAPDEPESEFGKGWMTDAIMDVPDDYVISDLDVRLTFTHENFIDLQIILQSPAGTVVVLNPALNMALLNIGGYAEIVFDDEAQVSIEQASIPFVSPFRPVWSLSLFDKEDSFGLWHLQIYDAFYADIGTLDSFELMITTPEPATAILLTLGAGLLLLLKPRRGR
jgi:subtilisin-like proprotein convertase family protein